MEWGVTPVLHYDPLGRLIETEQPNGTRARVVFDAWRQESWDENDAVLGTAWLIEREVPTADKQERRAAQRTLAHAGTPTVTHLDSLGRPFRTDEDNGGGAVYTTTLTLDIQGNQVEVKDAEDKTAALQVFDPLQRRIALHSCDAGMSWTFPDAADSPARSWDEREVFVRTSYDALRRPTHVWAREDVAPWLLAERLYYGETVIDAAVFNLRGQVAAHFDGAGLVAFERYDFKGGLELSTRRLAKSYTETADWSALSLVQGPLQAQGVVAALLETEAFSTESQYDALGRITHLHTPDESVSRFHYDEGGLLAGVDAKLRTSSAWSPFVTELAHNAKGQRERIVYANGTTTDSTYDPKTFRLKRLRTTRQSDGKVLQDLVYTHDPVGNITEIRDGAQQDLYFANEVVPANGLYRYDALYRLSEAKGREHAGQQPTHADLPWSSLPHANDVQAMQRYEERYTYDKVGNILEMAHSAGGAGWTRRYEYDDESNRLLSTSLPSDPVGGPNSQTYTHDPAGNMVRMPHLASMAWDWAGRLQHADKGGGGKVYFTYDTSNQRVRKVYEHSGVIEERIYLGTFELFRRRQSGTVQLQRETLHLMDDKRRIAMVETKTRDNGTDVSTPTPRFRYQLDNHLGSAALELDDAAQIISYEEYFPYGATSFRALKSGVDVSEKRYRYTGMERDEETGLNYHSARYFAPWLGRWTSADPAGFVDGLNLFRYCDDSPVGGLDPTGTQRMTDEQLGSRAAGTASRNKNALNPWDVVAAIVANPRVQGALQTTGALIEGGIALGLMAAPTGVTQVVGVLVMAKALDDGANGLKMMLTGKESQSYTHQAISSIAQSAGASPQTSEIVATSVDVLASTATAAAAAGKALKLEGAVSKELRAMGGGARAAGVEALDEAASARQMTEVKAAGKLEAAEMAAPTGQVLPALRQQYVDAVSKLANKVPEMRAAGNSSEEIARALHAERRALGVQFKALTPPDKLAEIYARNEAKYGDPLGPSIDWLRNAGKSWDDIIDSAVRAGGKDLGF
ncbi:RHS repeat domain-containing protein [Vulgatibacter incomptus]|uniref:Insecticidal toxin complex protein n=1 Tax=Vulgatibacter incomptus TaxID=1391653 RepID=A0A0K1PHT8_9BACT|nr:RHS repeat-associated core domain-containing protein [Vulgatibacter incomptus]AKU92966.1 insecticidal toxin complex protein [Vulgatibacter incomptus]